MPSNPDLRREQRRLHRAFAAVIAAVAPAAATAACWDDAPTRFAADPDGGVGIARIDAAMLGETGGEVDSAAEDAGPEEDADASDAPIKDCTMKVSTFDSGTDSGEPGCIYKLPCGLRPGLIVKGCDVYSEGSGPTDPDVPIGCSVEEGYGCLADAYAPGPDGEVHIVCPECLGGGGRRPVGLRRARAARSRSAAGAYFARMAHDEAAAVHAFLRLREDLVEHGAPAALVQAAERAARDEVRHARVMGEAARRRGAAVPEVRVRRARSRSLLAIARENAVEGCVQETFGALLAAWQAAHAVDAEVRADFARIAADEARHAALAWAVARWAEGRLSAGDRARVAAARSRAAAALCRCAPGAAFDGAVGRPGPRDREALARGLVAALGV